MSSAADNLVQSVAVTTESVRRVRRSARARRLTPRLVVAIPLVVWALTASGCGTTRSADRLTARSGSASTPGSATPKVTSTSAASIAMSTTTTATATAVPSLQGKVVTIDPGHNGDNFSDPAYIDALIWS